MTHPAPDDLDRHGLHQQNRRSWNAITPIHNSHKRDQAGFLRAGGSTLFPEELELLGDLRGQRLAHLQCNCGQDTLSLAARGATVVGVDIADQPIAFARQLAAASGIPATFHRADLFDWFDATSDRFDVVFTSYGGVGWLCDIRRWAAGVAKVLRPQGRLVLVEFHPLCWSLDSSGRIVAPYFVDGPIHEDDGVGDYVGAELAPSGFDPGITGFANPHRSVSFQYTVADITQSLIDAGLRIEALREYPYANGCQLLPGMRALPGRRFALPATVPAMPLMLGIAARRDR